MKGEHVAVVVRDCDADGLRLEVSDTVTAALVTFEVAADPGLLGPEPYSVTIIG